MVCDRDEEGTVSVGKVVCCDGDEQRAISITF